MKKEMFAFPCNNRLDNPLRNTNQEEISKKKNVFANHGYIFKRSARKKVCKEGVLQGPKSKKSSVGLAVQVQVEHIHIHRRAIKSYKWGGGGVVEVLSMNLKWFESMEYE